MERGSDVGDIVGMLESGSPVEEGAALRLLRSPHCPARAVELLALQSSLRRSQRLVTEILRHPACPRTFAWDALPTLGWRGLLSVARDNRTSPPIRRQAERKLAERISHLTLGERVALARQATRSLLPALARDGNPRCVRALLDNPRFTEEDAVRLVATAARPAVLSEVLRHPRWGLDRAVVRAAIRSPEVPLGIALGLAAALPVNELELVLRRGEVGDSLAAEITKLVERRRGLT